jgi:hypothetical protein
MPKWTSDGFVKPPGIDNFSQDFVLGGSKDLKVMMRVLGIRSG